MLKPTIEYMAMLYKYMTTVPKVNNKDWRISMNSIPMVQESTPVH